MCIRDRVDAGDAEVGDGVPRHRGDVLAEDDVAVGPGQLRHELGHGLSLIHISEPTETVLDLVCRLLLEKKN